MPCDFLLDLEVGGSGGLPAVSASELSPGFAIKVLFC